ncbi:HlyD family secretion protein [Jeongeupia wiesaeckerbachi]|uniref:HlyD family secretion protein n=1 Tax=Jeongeupia wiesaeckerbachi TaxID=3051218 RepID=UPI003D806F5C
MSEKTVKQPEKGRAARWASRLIVVLIVASLAWYFVADRLTPYSSQARVQAFVVPVAAEVAGKVKAVAVKNNDDVKQGQLLFGIDDSSYRIALERARADLESARDSIGAADAGVEAARASLRAAEAGRVKAEKDATRQERLYAEDPGAISVRRLEVARATRDQARAQVDVARAQVVQAQQNAGGSADNGKLASARTAVEKAELDLARTKVVSPSRGLVTDLRIDAGQFAQPGAPLLTLIAVHDLWISADMTENNLGHVEPGDRVGVVLDVLPGQVLEAKVRSVGNGVSAGKSTPAGSLPTVDNSRDWLRQAQRFPVAIEFEPAELEKLKGVRVGGQADVMVYTGDNGLMNLLGSAYLRLMSWLSYVY